MAQDIADQRHFWWYKRADIAGGSADKHRRYQTDKIISAFMFVRSYSFAIKLLQPFGTKASSGRRGKLIFI